MKKLTKFLSMLMALIITVSGAAACGGGGGGEDPNVNPDGTRKTRINVEIVDVGYGTSYLENLEKQFEQNNVEKSYKEGEKGVNIVITPYKGYLSEDKFISNDYDLFFGTGSGSLQKWAANGSLLDITDIATVPLSEYGETRSIVDKFYDGADLLYKYNNKVYALPGFWTPYGITYNVDIWERYKLYFNKDNEFITSLNDIANKNLGTGPDGYEGTYDDGLPRTYEEFFKVCDKLVGESVVPFIWDGKDYVYYLEDFVESLHMNAETIDQFMLNYTFSGNATSLVKTANANGTVVLENSTPINNNNGYELYSQAGAFYATYFMSKMLGNSKYYDESIVFNNEFTNLMAQHEFLKTDAVNGADEIAMLVEGGYWEQEAYENGLFNKVAVYGDEFKRENRRLAFMPMPMPTLEMVTSHKGHNLAGVGYVTVAASANIEAYKIPLVKDFIKFCFTDAKLVETTEKTSMFYALEYEFDQDSYENLTPFGKSIADFMQSETTHMKMATSDNALYMENSGSFDCHKRYASKLANGSSHGAMFSVFKTKSVSATDYFYGMENRIKETWATTYSKYLTQD